MKGYHGEGPGVGDGQRTMDAVLQREVRLTAAADDAPLVPANTVDVIAAAELEAGRELHDPVVRTDRHGPRSTTGWRRLCAGCGTKHRR